MDSGPYKSNECTYLSSAECKRVKNIPWSYLFCIILVCVLRGLDRWRIHINMKAKIFQKYILINIGFVKIILHKLYLGISMQQALSRTMQVGRYTISRTNHWCGNKDILQGYILTMLETTIHEQHSFLFTATFEGCQLSFCVVKRKWINYFKSIIIYSSFVVIYLSFAWK